MTLPILENDCNQKRFFNTVVKLVFAFMLKKVSHKRTTLFLHYASNQYRFWMKNRLFHLSIG